MAIKRTQADINCSRAIREAANNVCEICKSRPATEVMHYHGRRAYAVRFHPDNLNAGCHGCHRKMDENPDRFYRWKEEQIGAGRMQMLREMREDTSLAKLHKKNIKAVSAHFRQELERIQELRESGETGTIEVEPFA